MVLEESLGSPMQPASLRQRCLGSRRLVTLRVVQDLNPHIDFGHIGCRPTAPTANSRYALFRMGRLSELHLSGSSDRDAGEAQSPAVVLRLQAEHKFKIILTAPVHRLKDGVVLDCFVISASRPFERGSSTIWTARIWSSLRKRKQVPSLAFTKLHAPLKAKTTFVVVDAAGGTVISSCDFL